MEQFVKGDVVVVPFPFSDLSNSKKRPALVLTSLKGDDIILCQITSKMIKDEYYIEITDNDFKDGGLNQVSNVRPNRLFTADKNIVLYKVGEIKAEMMKGIIKRIIELFD